MQNKLREYFAGKKILILGFGREGRSSYELVRRLLPQQEIVVVDRDTGLVQKFPVLATDEAVELRLGEQYLDGLTKYDLIVKAPGVSLKDLDVEPLAEKITSQLEILLELFPGMTIGVTGTKGKSTISSLIYQILQDQNRSSLLLGNIGTPVFEHLAEITPDMVLVLEMSSHQLEFLRRSPRIAVLTNVYPEHLDHYRSFADYTQAKMQIWRHQSASDYVIYNIDNAVLRDELATAVAQKISVSLESKAEVCRKDDWLYVGNEAVLDCTVSRKLLGDYNLYNIMLVLGVVKALRLDLAKAARTICDFETLHHRLEFVAEVAGVKYYDNSIGTVPEATMAAMQALGDVDTVIVGGMDRGIDYANFCQFLDNDAVRNVICMSETGRIIAKRLASEKVYSASNLEEAVKLAKKCTAKGKSCLLSPAAASYGEFKNFEEKGDLFQKLVKEE